MTILCRTLATAFSVATFASAAHAASRASSPVVLRFEPSAASLPARAIRDALEKELERPVRSTADGATADGATAEMTIAQSSDGKIVIRYRPDQGELERVLRTPHSREEAPAAIAALAKSLVTGEVVQPNVASGDSVTSRNGTRDPRLTEVSGGERLSYHDTTSSSFYARLSAGIGYGAAVYAYQGPSRIDGHTIDLSAGVSGPVASLHAAFGVMTTSGVAFGLEITPMLNGPTSQQGSLQSSHIGPFILRLQAGPFVDFYPQARGPLHLEAGASVGAVTFSYSTAECDCVGDGIVNGVNPKTLLGGLGYLGAGYDFGRDPGGIGLFARTYVGFYRNDTSSYTPFEVHLGASVAWF
jgi:hypothetical protein